MGSPHRLIGSQTILTSKYKGLIPNFGVPFDAFSCDWSGENNWLVPPIECIGLVLKHIQVCSAVGTLIVSFWPSAPLLAHFISE